MIKKQNKHKSNTKPTPKNNDSKDVDIINNYMEIVSNTLSQWYDTKQPITHFYSKDYITPYTSKSIDDVVILTSTSTRKNPDIVVSVALKDGRRLGMVSIKYIHPYTLEEIFKFLNLCTDI